MSKKQLKKNLKGIPSKLLKFKKARVGILGDICLDRFLYGQVRRISPEAPVPVVLFKKEIVKLGMSGNVAVNVAELGAQAILFGVLGKDSAGENIEKLIGEYKNIKNKLIVSEDRSSIQKTRILAENQHIVRLDQEETGQLSLSIQRRILEKLDEHSEEIDVLVIQEHAKGLFGSNLSKKVFAMMKKKGVPVYVDPNRETSALLYKGAQLITPNLTEFISFCAKGSSAENLNKLAKDFIQKFKIKELIITKGGEGMSIYTKDGLLAELPAFAREVFEVTGAGDSVIAMLAMGRAVGLGLKDSATLASLAASVVVGKVGTSTANAKEITDLATSALA